MPTTETCLISPFFRMDTRLPFEIPRIFEFQAAHMQTKHATRAPAPETNTNKQHSVYKRL